MHDMELREVNYSEKTSESIVRIVNYVATLIEDVSTLQMGIGSIPDYVLKNLGLHTEMFSDGNVCAGGALFFSGAAPRCFHQFSLY